MKRGSEILSFIKPSSRKYSMEIKDLLYEANGYVYRENKTYITEMAARGVLNDLIEIGKKLASAETKTAEQIKSKQEIIEGLRANVKSLKQYITDGIDYPKEQLDQIAKYQLSSYLSSKDKIECLNDLDKLLRIAKANKVYNDTIFKNNNFENRAFEKMQKEIIAIVTEKLSLT